MNNSNKSKVNSKVLQSCQEEPQPNNLTYKTRHSDRFLTEAERG